MAFSCLPFCWTNGGRALRLLATGSPSLFLQPPVKQGLSFAQLLWSGMETTGQTAQLPRETWDCTVASGFWWVCPGHQEWLALAHSHSHTGRIPCAPRLGGTGACTWIPHSCLPSGRVSLALAEVHLFMLLTNSQSYWLGRVESNIRPGRGRKGKRRQFLPQ